MHYKTETLRTTIHAEVVDWARNRNGKPVRIPKNNPHEPGLGPIKILFPEDKESGYEEITWDEFLQDFENKQLMMVYKENTEEGTQSHFYTFEKRQKENYYV